MPDRASRLEKRGPRTLDSQEVLIAVVWGEPCGRGSLLDLILVDGNPLEDLNLVADSAKNIFVIMKDGKIYKNTVK